MKYFFILFLCLNTTIDYSQNGKIFYTSSLSFGDEGSVTTSNYLYFTNYESFYKSEIIDEDLKTENESNTKNDEFGNKLSEINITVGSDSIGDTYYRNLKNNKIIVRSSVFENNKLKYYKYEDDVVLNWELLNEFKEISNYKCQKALTKFRGRNYEAWFTSEIPLSFGPWKFSGLPGLILEVYDQTGEVYFSAENVQIPYSTSETIVDKPADGLIMTFKEFVEKGDNNIEKIIQAALARSPEGTTLVSTKVEKNGIELKYPWEKK